MDKKKIIIIGIIIFIIAAAILLILTAVTYERIEITPHGTTIEVPANQTKYAGNVQGTKIWNWNNGIMVAYNSNADKNIVKVSEVGFDALNKLIKTGEMQNIDGYTCYVINADKLFEIHIFDIIKVNYNGKFYCIPLSNETTHDNIIICCNDKDMAIHMAKSVEYKNVYPDNNNNLDNAVSNVKNMAGDLSSKAKSYTDNINLTDIKSTVEGKTGIDLNNIESSVKEKTGVDLGKTKNKIDEVTGKLPI